MANPNLTYDLVIDDSRARSTLGGLTKTAGDEGEKFGKAFTTSAASFFTGQALFAGFTRALSALSDQVKEVANLQTAFAEVTTILPEGVRLTDRLRDSVRELSEEYGKSQTEQVRAYYQIVSAGTTDTAQALDLLNSANKLALGGLSDVGSSINVLTDIVNVYGKETLSTTEIIDSLFTTVRLGKTRIDSLTSSIGQVIPTAQQLGVSLDEVNATIATLTTRGLATAERVTQLNAVFTALLRNGNRAQKMGGAIADAFTLTALRTKGLATFMQDLFNATGRSAEKLQELIGNTEGVRAILTLASDDFVKLNENIDAFAGKSGAADQAADRMRETLNFQWDVLTTQVQNLALSFLNDLTPAMITFVDIAQQSIPIIASVIAGLSLPFNALFTGLKAINAAIWSFVSGLLGLASKIPGVSGMISGLKQEVDSLTSSSFDSLSLSAENMRNNFNELLNPSTENSAGAAIKKMRMEMEKMALATHEAQAKVAESAPSIAEVWKALGDSFSTTASKMVKNAKQMAKAVSKTLINGVGRGAANAFASFGKAIAEGENALDAFLGSFLASMGQMAIEVGTMFVLQGVAASIAGLGNGPAMIAAGAALAAFGGVMGAVFGGGESGSSGASSATGSAGMADTMTSEDMQTEEEQERKTEVNVVFQGSVMGFQDKRTLAKEIADSLNVGARDLNIKLNPGVVR